MSEQPVFVTKVRAGFYRVGALCIHKGRWWSVYDGPDLLYNGRFVTLADAAAWARDNQPARAALSPPRPAAMGSA